MQRSPLKKGGDLNGIIVADKPAGWTSHDVVAKVKRTLGAKKVGHLGTLDPLATGVLPLVINGATRYARFLEGGLKVYEARMRLGVATDTYDSTGKVLAEIDPSGVKEDDVRSALNSFVGQILQVPPMFSAIKRDGVPLYKLARAGAVVERQAKEITITAIEAVAIELPDVAFKVWASRGTYVRSICHDMGALLGCGGHMTALRRVGCGIFSIDEAIDPRACMEELTVSLMPLDVALLSAGVKVGAHGQAELAAL